MEVEKRLIIALDFPDATTALQFVSRISPDQCRLKVGFELFVSAGPQLVEKLVKQGFDVFLDLKFHDIPNTVASACRSAGQLGVWMLNVHALGGPAMLEAAAEANASLPEPPLLIAVTVLTSMDRQQLQSIGLINEPEEQVLLLAEKAKACGLDGVVCSAWETERLKQVLGKQFTLVTPGIRPLKTASGDQKRIMTPGEAISAGSNYLVVGRPITQSSDPMGVIEAINRQIASVSAT